MTDKEKVRQGICQCLLYSGEEEFETQCLDCPYYDKGTSIADCKKQLRNDFTAFMKEQEDMLHEEYERGLSVGRTIKWG